MRWQAEEDQYLLSHYRNRGDLKSIAKRLDRSEESCRKRLYRIKGTDSKTEREDQALLVEQHWFTSRSASGRLSSLPKLPKGAVSAAQLAPWGGKKRGGNAYRHTRTGYRPDIGLNVRSGWEANVCRVLKSYGIPFEFEPAVFTFPVKRGNKSYKPDIYLPTTNEWIEVKGYFDKDSMIKMRRFKKYYPKEWETLTMIISKSSKASRDFCAEHEVPNVLYYQDIEKVYRSRIPNWEGKKGA